MKKNASVGGQTVLNYTPSASGAATGSLTSWRFDQKEVRLALCEMIILDELPFIFVEREGFRRFVDRICPQFQISSKQTVHTDCVKLFLDRTDVIKSFYQKKKRHGDWILHKKTITFCPILSHKGTDIGEKVVTSLKEWGLKNVLCCTTDNETSNDGAIRHVRAYLDMIESNVVGDEIGMSVRRVREAVKWVKASPARNTKFFDCVTVLKTNLLGKKHDKDPIGLFEASDWVNVRKIIEYLKEFYELTLLFSDDREISSMAVNIRIKIGKYWLEEEANDSDKEAEESDANELAVYLTEKQFKLSMDVVDISLIFCSGGRRIYSPQYLILSEMAWDILAIPTSSVASESAFSTGGRVLSSYRSSLASSMVEALICAEDWLKSSSINKKDKEGVPIEALEREFQMGKYTL
ncbi:uncharacterized protein LOC130994013 [Salvia miltiorrhiza]|uniref:uncharacterized protein LOC130994013 n=1 Tax=Salvia miltiorrhiza TaxID=226208 RepID=UPI0025AB8B52|nr:uncharacterized protein LOC130994013 [Salvia miltiorrhiza]